MAHHTAPSKGSAASSRRDVLRWGAAAGSAAVTSAIMNTAYAAQDNTIRLALIGCGGRGSGAAANALSTDCGPVKLHAMADVVETKLKLSHTSLAKRFGDKVDVVDDRKFLGFDAFKQAIDTLKPGDVALCTTHAYCRPQHVEYAVSKGIHVFMEKPFASDPAGLKRILKAGEEAAKKNLKLAAGLMCRHSANRQEMIARARAGELGDVQYVRAYRMDNGSRLGRRDASQSPSDMEYQIRRPIHFHWAGGGRFVDYMIHQVDECCWIMDGWPVAAQALGGREPGAEDCGQNLHTYAVEYTFADGRKAMVDGRYMPRCQTDFVTYIHGAKKAAQFSGPGHRGDAHIYKDQRCTGDNIEWKAPAEQYDPWQAEWNVLMQKIRRDEPHNEAQRAVMANHAANMGRAAAHTGQIVTLEQATGSDFAFLPADVRSFDDVPPAREDASGQYPVPIPGKWQEM